MESTGVGSCASSVAFPVAPERFAVIVCVPGAAGVQVAAIQEPSGAIVNVAVVVTSPRELPYASKASVEYVCGWPTVIDEDDGDRTRWSTAAGLTWRGVLPLAPPLVPVTVCVPDVVAVQTLPLHVPSGAREKVVVEVRSPRELSY